MNRYSARIYWSDEDEVFIAEIPELPGCMAHGQTREEALAQAQEAIELWLDVARRRKREIPQPRAHRLIA